MADIAFDDQVDITDKVCPLTFVKAKVAIEELDDGEVLAIRMNDGEPVQNAARSWHRFSEISRMIMRISFMYTRSTQTLTESSLMSMR